MCVFTVLVWKHFVAALSIRNSFSFSSTSFCIHVLLESIVLSVKSVASVLAWWFLQMLMYFNSQFVSDTHKQLIFPYQVEFCFWKLLIITTIVCEKTSAKTRNCFVNHLYSDCQSKENHWWWKAASPCFKLVVTFEIIFQLHAEFPVFHI